VVTAWKVSCQATFVAHPMLSEDGVVMNYLAACHCTQMRAVANDRYFRGDEEQAREFMLASRCGVPGKHASLHPLSRNMLQSRKTTGIKIDNSMAYHSPPKKADDERFPIGNVFPPYRLETEP
jgi:hypothetical protein